MVELIFKTCLRNGSFPKEWKKADAVPIHKECDMGKYLNASI